MTSDPKRLTIVGATDLERSLLQAARHERPSPELTARMAAGLGISAAAVVTAAAPAVAAKTTLATSAWISAGVVAVVVTAGVVGVRLSATPERGGHVRKPAPAVIAPARVEPPVAAPTVDPVTAVRAEKRIEKVHRRPAAPPPAADLRDQIALMDAARTAVKAGSTERALLLLHRYDATYPAGAFRPEALALRIEALDEGERSAEARALAREFLARYPDSPVAERVARVADPTSR